MLEVRGNNILITGDFEGCLPVRVLQNNVTQFFLTANSRAESDWQAMVANGRINPELALDIRPAAVLGPFIDAKTRIIEIQETFEAALWGTSYGLMVLLDSWSTMYQNGKQLKRLDDSDPQIKEAFGLLAYVETLFRTFQLWPNSCPNPENYSLDNRDYVEKANNLYVSATAFALAHEFAHACLGHCDAAYHALLIKAHKNPIALTGEEKTVLKQLEMDADRYAVDHFLSELEDDGERTVRLFGIVITYLTLLIGTKDWPQLESATHPDLGTRILTVLSYDIFDEGFKDSLRGGVFLALTYFLERQGVKLDGYEFENAEAALTHCLGKLDGLKKM